MTPSEMWKVIVTAIVGLLIIFLLVILLVNKLTDYHDINKMSKRELLDLRQRINERINKLSEDEENE